MVNGFIFLGVHYSCKVRFLIWFSRKINSGAYLWSDDYKVFELAVTPITQSDIILRQIIFLTLIFVMTFKAFFLFSLAVGMTAMRTSLIDVALYVTMYVLAFMSVSSSDTEPPRIVVGIFTSSKYTAVFEEMLKNQTNVRWVDSVCNFFLQDH